MRLSLAAIVVVGVGVGAHAGAMPAASVHMGRVNQDTATHVFETLPNGGRIAIQAGDDAGAEHIRPHLVQMALAFESGDFAAPSFTHLKCFPGVSVMIAKGAAITYRYRELPRGGELAFITQDREAVASVHDYLTFLKEHHQAMAMMHGQHHHAQLHHQRMQDHGGTHAGCGGVEHRGS